MNVSNKTAVLVLVAILTSVSILRVSVHDVHAQSSSYNLDGSSPSSLHQSTLDCASIGGSWSNATVACTVSDRGSIASEDSLYTSEGAELVIGKGAVFTNFGTFGNAGTFTITGGTIINSGGNITNLFIINNGSNSTITNDSNSTITNFGDISNFGDIANSGTIISSGNITNEGGTITNSGTIDSCNGLYGSSGTFSGNPVMTDIATCLTTSVVSTPAAPSTTTTSPISGSSRTIELGVILVLAVLAAITFFLWRGGIILARNKLPPQSQPIT